VGRGQLCPHHTPSWPAAIRRAPSWKKSYGAHVGNRNEHWAIFIIRLVSEGMRKTTGALITATVHRVMINLDHVSGAMPSINLHLYRHAHPAGQSSGPTSRLDHPRSTAQPAQDTAGPPAVVLSSSAWKWTHDPLTRPNVKERSQVK